MAVLWTGVYTAMKYRNRITVKLILSYVLRKRPIGNYFINKQLDLKDVLLCTVSKKPSKSAFEGFFLV